MRIEQETRFNIGDRVQWKDLPYVTFSVTAVAIVMDRRGECVQYHCVSASRIRWINGVDLEPAPEPRGEAIAEGSGPAITADPDADADKAPEASDAC